MTVLLAFLQFIIVSYITIYEYRRKSLSVVMWATLFIMFSLLHFLSILLGNISYPKWVMNEASMFVILFSCLYLFARTFFVVKPLSVSSKYPYSYFQDKLSKTDSRFVVLLAFLLFLTISLKLYGVYQHSGSLFDSSWETQLTSSREASYFNLNRLLNPLFLPLTAVLLISFYTKKKLLFYSTICFLLFNIIITRNRIELLPFLVAFLLHAVFNYKLTAKQIFKYAIFGCFAIYLIYGFQVFRYYGAISSFMLTFEIGEFNSAVIDNIFNEKGELGLRNAFYYFIYNDNDFQNFGKGHTYIRLLLFWLPTQWSAGIKPNDFAIAMGKAIDPTSNGYSMHPTLFGDCYANLGFLGVFFGLFWSIFVSVIDRLQSKLNNSILKYPLAITFGSSFIIIGRGSVYNSLTLAIFGFLYIYIIYRLINRPKIRVK